MNALSSFVMRPPRHRLPHSHKIYGYVKMAIFSSCSQDAIFEAKYYYAY